VTRKRFAGCSLAGALAVSACVGQDVASPRFKPHLDISAPDRVIGHEDGPGLVFGLIADVEVLDDGSLLVVDKIDARVVHVGPDGTLLGVLGGAGAGPGEFSTPVAIIPVGFGEYAVLDADRPELTRLKVEGPSLVLAGKSPIPSQALRMCQGVNGLVLDTYRSSYAVDLVDSTGKAVGGYHRLPEVVDDAYPVELQDPLRTWLGLSIPLCRSDGEVAILPEWDPILRGFHPDGSEAWAIELSEHSTIRWEEGADGDPQPSLPPAGWAHRGATLVEGGRDLLIAQLLSFDATREGRDRDPVELRILRPSDGSQARIEMEIPRIVSIQRGHAWAWSNVPFPRVVRFGFEVSLD
jgi:hypothetical protein